MKNKRLLRRKERVHRIEEEEQVDSSRKITGV